MWGKVLYCVRHYAVNREHVLSHVNGSTRKDAAAPIAGMGVQGIELVCLVGLLLFHDASQRVVGSNSPGRVSLYLVQAVLI